MDWLNYLLLVLMALLFVFLLLVKPGKRRETGIDTVYAHRGYHDDDRPENSLAAFAHAREHDLGVELDVQFTRDKKLVVFHDKNLKRMTGVDKDLPDVDFDELETYRLAGTEERIPLFSEVLETLDGTPVICEIKTYSGNANCESCPEVCRMIDRYKGHVVVESFSPYILKWFRKNRPDIIRGQLSQNFLKRGGLSGVQALALGNLLTNFMARPDFIAYNYQDSSLGLSTAELFGPALVAWTVRGKDALEEAAIKGYGTFICENFDLEHALDYENVEDAE